MLSKKIKIILNFLLLKKGSSAKFTHVNLAAQTAHFLVNYVFGQKIHFQKKKWGEGEKWNVFFFLIRRERKKKVKLFRSHNYDGYPPLPPLKTLLPPRPNYVNLYLHMVPKYPMRKIHPSKNGGGIRVDFHCGKYLFFLLQVMQIYIGKTYISKFSSFVYFID